MLNAGLHKVTLTVNGTTYTEAVGHDGLADFLRHKLGLAGPLAAAWWLCSAS